jgi:protein-S-isoprenylcysteine O-methyltransferase Ste14
MYAGFILWIQGWIMWCGTGIRLISGIAAVGCMLYWRRLDEEKLVAVYGEEYRKYQQKTRF